VHLEPTPIERLVARRRDRAIAIVLALKERECDAYLPEEASRKLRKVILDQFNELAALVGDVADSGVILNQEYLEKLDAIFASLDLEVA
jgi:hypothetical protein